MRDRELSGSSSIAQLLNDYLYGVVEVCAARIRMSRFIPIVGVGVRVMRTNKDREATGGFARKDVAVLVSDKKALQQINIMCGLRPRE